MAELVITSVSRPDPKSYFGPADAGFLDWDTLVWRFAAERSYWLATMGETPHSMPVWGIWQDATFRFSTSPASRKARNLRAHPKATVHLASTEALMSMECDAVEITDAAQRQRFVDDYNPKYRWEFTADDVRDGLFSLIPYKAFAWSAGEGDAFHNTATRWTFDYVS